MSDNTQPNSEISLLQRIRMIYEDSDAKSQLFKTKLHTVITLVSLVIVVWALFTIAQFLVTAEWQVISDKRRAFMIGRYPEEHVWRIWPTVWMFAGLAGLSSALWLRPGRRMMISLFIAAAIVSYLFLEFDSNALKFGFGLLLGLCGYALGYFTYTKVSLNALVVRIAVLGWVLLIPVILVLLFIGDAPSTNYWGGLFVNIILAAIAIVVGTPLAVVLALGRTKEGYPIIRILSTTIIEVVRGAPLIAWLFMGRFVLPFILPSWFGLNEADVIIRTMIILIVFNAAYTAEVVRGGLQAIPKGQYEAANSVGFNGWQTLRLILLPQALRAVLPSLINQYIGLFKDTTLVYLISVVDVLEVGRKAFNELAYTGTALEVLVFVGFLFWIVTWSMSNLSKKVEENLGLGTR
ncbi:MAG TPA: amino acid ABC transporter permease [Dehalococcoidia bacterium]|jgi:general L-amino acid transport system permease protein|nr:amino acid ABC transporter permease [Dehalococcoidia bacterium]